MPPRFRGYPKLVANPDGTERCVACGLCAAVCPPLAIQLQADETEYHWTLSGTYAGPGGTGNRVRISGFERWRIGSDGLIASSQGHFDAAAEYRRQLEQGSDRCK